MVFYYRFVNLNPIQQVTLQISPALVQKRLNEIFSGEAVCKSKDATLFLNIIWDLSTVWIEKDSNLILFM